MGVGQSLDGGYQELTEDEDTSPYSARSLISISPQEFRLAPGSSQDIEVIVAVPSDIGSGGRYAIIYTHNEPADQSGTSIVSAVGSSVVLTLTDTELTKDGTITNLDFGEPGSGEPLDVTVIFQNTGNYHYKARAEVSLSDAEGNVLAKTSSSLCTSSIIPGYSRQFTVSLAPEQALPEGEYYVESSVVLEDGTLLDTTEIKLDDGDIQGTVQGIDAERTETDTTRIIAIIIGATVAAVLLAYFLVIRKRRAANR
jgi:hypothetical protein